MVDRNGKVVGIFWGGVLFTDGLGVFLGGFGVIFGGF